jgi:transcriptional regulator with XRE-family HTH domain
VTGKSQHPRNTPALPPQPDSLDSVGKNDVRTIVLDRDRLIRLRRNFGWSQAMLAAKSGLSEDTVSRSENHRAIRLGAAHVIATTFGIALSELLTNKADISRKSDRARPIVDYKRNIQTTSPSTLEFFVPRSRNGPEIDFTFAQNKLSIRGICDAHRIQDLLEQSRAALSHLLEAVEGCDIEFVFEIEYISTLATPGIREIALLLARSRCASTLVRWKYEKHNEQIFSIGRVLKELFDANRSNEGFIFFVRKSITESMK